LALFHVSILKDRLVVFSHSPYPPPQKKKRKKERSGDHVTRLLHFQTWRKKSSINPQEVRQRPLALFSPSLKQGIASLKSVIGADIPLGPLADEALSVCPRQSIGHAQIKIIGAYGGLLDTCPPVRINNRITAHVHYMCDFLVSAK
jgi:hypothetical protein